MLNIHCHNITVLFAATKMCSICMSCFVTPLGIELTFPRCPNAHSNFAPVCSNGTKNKSFNSLAFYDYAKIYIHSSYKMAMLEYPFLRHPVYLSNVGDEVKYKHSTCI